MRFWDSAAIVPLIVAESISETLRTVYESDSVQSVWCLTPVEVWSAIARKRRQSVLDSPAMRDARVRLDRLATSWHEISDIPAVRRRAQRLLDVHALRAADALQLAAALVLVSDRPEGFEFVTLDDRLAEAAESEAFRVVLPA
jgi:uncharacterized protein